MILTVKQWRIEDQLNKTNKMIQKVKQWKLGEQYIEINKPGMYDELLRIKDNVLFEGGLRKCEITYKGRKGHILCADGDNIHVRLAFKIGNTGTIKDYELLCVEINDIELA